MAEHSNSRFLEAAGEKPEALVHYVSPEYFPVLRIPLDQGRMWDHAETMRGAAVAVINQTMARQFWPNSNPVGQQIRLPDLKDEPYSPVAPGIEGAWMQIVGVWQMLSTMACASPSSLPSTFLTP